MSMQNGQYVGNVISICKCLQDESIKGSFSFIYKYNIEQNV